MNKITESVIEKFAIEFLVKGGCQGGGTLRKKFN
jgi:hypothetical protein